MYNPWKLTAFSAFLFLCILLYRIFVLGIQQLLTDIAMINLSKILRGLVVMTKTEALEQTIQIIHQDMDWFIGIVSILIALFAFFQWKLSEKQIRKIKEETLREAKKEFHR